MFIVIPFSLSLLFVLTNSIYNLNIRRHCPTIVHATLLIHKRMFTQLVRLLEKKMSRRGLTLIAPATRGLASSLADLSLIAPATHGPASRLIHSNATSG